MLYRNRVKLGPCYLPFCMYTKQEPIAEHYLRNAEPLLKACMRLEAGLLVNTQLERKRCIDTLPKYGPKTFDARRST